MRLVMKLNVAFHYQVYFVPHRGIKERSDWRASETEIDIREIDRAAVKTVFRVGTLPAGRTGEPRWKFDDPYCAKPDGSMREIVSYDGALWVEAMPVQNVVTPLTDDAGKGTPFENLGLRATKKPDHKGELPAVLKSPDQLIRSWGGPLRSLRDDDGARVRESLEKRARSTVLIDGTIYVRCHEPILYIGNNGYGKSAIKFGAVDRYGSINGSDIASYRGLLQGDDARAYYYNLNEEQTGLAHLVEKHPDDEVVRVAQVEVVDPNAVTATPHIRGVLTSATSALTQLWAYPMAMLPDHLERAIELRDALSESWYQITPRLLRALQDVASMPQPTSAQLDRWRKLAECRPHQPHRPGEHDRSGRNEASRACQIIAHLEQRTKASEFAAIALRRFTSRPKGLSWEDRALQLNFYGEEVELWSVELLSLDAIKAIARNIGLDASPVLAAIADGGRAFAVGTATAEDWNSAQAIVAAVQEDGRFTVSGGESQHRKLIEQHIVAALDLDPHLAQDRAASMEMAP